MLGEGTLIVRQALELGGHVRKGESGSYSVFYSSARKTDTDRLTGESTEKTIRFMNTPPASATNSVSVRCAAIPQTVWVNAYGRDFCVRYYMSTAGGEGRRPVVFLQGDQFGALADEFDKMPCASAIATTEVSYEIEANWKVHYDNFQENYHLRFIHARTGGPATGPANPMGYPTHYGFNGPHRSQTLWKNPEPPQLPASMMLSSMRAAALPQPFAKDFAKTDFKLFPCFHVVWLSPDTMFTHTHMPVSATRTRSRIRMYWASESETASRAFAREFAMMSLRDVLSEDRDAVEAAQRGIASGVLDRINLQDHEVLLRHSYQQVVARVTAWREARATGGPA